MTVATWFEAVAEAEPFQPHGESGIDPQGHRAALRAGCAAPNRPAPPATGPDIAAVRAAKRQRGLTPNSIELRRASIRYLHRAAGCPVPTDDACVAEIVAGIRRDIAGRGEQPAKKAAAIGAVLRQILAPIPADLRSLRDRALLLVGFAGALRRSTLAALPVAQLETTALGLRLTLPQAKGSQTEAVTVHCLRPDRTLPGERAHRLAERPHYVWLGV